MPQWMTNDFASDGTSNRLLSLSGQDMSAVMGCVSEVDVGLAAEVVVDVWDSLTHL